MANEKKSSSELYRFWKILGSGLVTGASDDDPSGIATYSQAGAAFGLATLCTCVFRPWRTLVPEDGEHL
jgi:Mn2+/Fe2+ NRAMP family transporter